MTFSRSLLLGLGILALVVGPQSLCAAKRKAAAAVEEGSYKGAIVMDAATGGVLYEDRADTVTPPASMTKLMTFAVLNDHLAAGTLTLQTPVTTEASDCKMGGTQVWLKEHEVFPVEELLYAMMIQSANDAAHALARTACGSTDAFVAEMNAKARALGMTHTTFRTPHGLPPSSRSLSESDMTSARDYALLARHLVTNTDILKYTIRQRSFGAPNRVQLVDMINHNHLIGRVEGVDGLKTGYTAQAMFCLAATAERAGRRVIVVVMGGSSSKSRDQKVIELLEMGFAKIPVGSTPFVARYHKASATPARAGGIGAIGAPAAADSPFASAPLESSEDGPVAAGSAPAAASNATGGEEPMVRFNIPASPKKAK